ncbi:MAG: PBECR2 nuclease fold domain-containing protein [Muribaculaceae bacterium]|nr:PBECR2 nuclease fold domain-containing protein [Muribaculaceae bacterium]
MKIIGRLNIEIFKCIDSGIISDEVIITEERIQHIKERHPNDYERYCLYMKEVVENPEYIIEANKPRSALILKSFSEGNEQFKTVLRLVTPEDNKDFKNSVITFMKINEKEWNRLIKNKKILYKSE